MQIKIFFVDNATKMSKSKLRQGHSTEWSHAVPVYIITLHGDIYFAPNIHSLNVNVDIFNCKMNDVNDSYIAVALSDSLFLPV